MNNKLLIIDDEADILNMLKDVFEFENYTVFTAEDADVALDKLKFAPDLILLDINMPKMDGIEFCQKIRSYVDCPIIFLTANVEDVDKINGFKAGGDDYITKPFSISELKVRVEAHIRRQNRIERLSKVRFDNNLVIDYSEHKVYYNDQEIPFPKKEFSIIELLSTNPKQTFAREKIYETIWGYDSEGDSSVVAEHIRRIRNKLMAATNTQYIETVWGVGYLWKK